jgi:hypothetical protein
VSISDDSFLYQWTSPAYGWGCTYSQEFFKSLTKKKAMKVEIKYKEIEKPIESVTLTLTPEEVEYIRYWASLTAQRYATATACNAANRLDKLLPKTGVGYHPEKCFL